MRDNNNGPAASRGRSGKFFFVYSTGTFIVSLGALAVVVLSGGHALWVAVISAAVVIQTIMLIALKGAVDHSKVIGPGDAAGSPDEIFDAETEERLQVLEEAGRFFGTAISPEDVFPLLTERVREIVPFDALVLLVAEDSKLVQVYSGGRVPGPSDATVPGSGLEMATRAFETGSVAISGNLPHPGPAQKGKFLSVAAVPLTRGSEVFAVISFCSFVRNAFGGREKILFEAVGERVAPLVGGAMAYGRQLSNSLTDPITDLPNERAFRLVLEGRVAEAQRYKEDRPLVVLAIDLRGFSHLNTSHEHNTGDRALAFAAGVISGELRKMDMVARTRDDEFLAVLPSAGNDTAAAIISRIGGAFSSRKFPLPDEPEFTIELHTGFASFLRDGRSADELIKAARLRRDRSKINKSNQVILFPTQYPN